MLQMNARNVRKRDNFMILIFSAQFQNRKQLKFKPFLTKIGSEPTVGLSPADAFVEKWRVQDRHLRSAIFQVLRSEHSQTDIEDGDQCDSKREAGQDQSFTVFQHFSQESMRGQIQKPAADVRHD